MKWTVTGADQRSGVDRTIEVDADTERQAVDLARSLGLFTSSIQPAVAPGAAESLPSLDEEVVENDQVDFVPVPESPRPRPVAYATPETSRRAPTYVGLRIGATILGIMALLYYAAALVMLFVMLGTVGRMAPFMDLTTFGLMMLWVLMIASAGGLMHALSAGCTALRDIARNSFR